jgi:hypothetical protein
MRKISFVVVFILGIAAVSCSSNKGDGEVVLNQDKMSDVIYDVLLAESFVESYLMKDTTKNKDSLLRVEMDKVLKVYGISAQEFATSYHYYKAHPLQFEAVLDSANERAIRGRTDVFIRRRPNKSN